MKLEGNENPKLGSVCHPLPCIVYHPMHTLFITKLPFYRGKSKTKKRKKMKEIGERGKNRIMIEASQINSFLFGREPLSALKSTMELAPSSTPLLFS
ncbi:hypothetical protein LR48_Vigan04g143000 [Vigna angularis]|uniref:Uncharacterized protein n=1 Tax=Phaseolus angularis TaxID=3914 RepID=A0A0L9UF89_PHAAN|nr:hypothetical protein LR48_Vigan04g143000 [Vigna angularis]